MGEKYIMKKDDVGFEMGASIDDVEPGDAIKVGPGRLEIIARITPVGKWNKHIETESGRTYDMLDVRAYGKRK